MGFFTAKTFDVYVDYSTTPAGQYDFIAANIINYGFSIEEVDPNYYAVAVKCDNAPFIIGFLLGINFPLFIRNTNFSENAMTIHNPYYDYMIGNYGIAPNFYVSYSNGWEETSNQNSKLLATYLFLAQNTCIICTKWKGYYTDKGEAEDYKDCVSFHNFAFGYVDDKLFMVSISAYGDASGSLWYESNGLDVPVSLGSYYSGTYKINRPYYYVRSRETYPRFVTIISSQNTVHYYSSDINYRLMNQYYGEKAQYKFFSTVPLWYKYTDDLGQTHWYIIGESPFYITNRSVTGMGSTVENVDGSKFFLTKVNPYDSGETNFYYIHQLCNWAIKIA